MMIIIVIMIMVKKGNKFQEKKLNICGNIWQENPRPRDREMIKDGVKPSKKVRLYTLASSNTARFNSNL